MFLEQVAVRKNIYTASIGPINIDESEVKLDGIVVYI